WPGSAAAAATRAASGARKPRSRRRLPRPVRRPVRAAGSAAVAAGPVRRWPGSRRGCRRAAWGAEPSVRSRRGLRQQGQRAQAGMVVVGAAAGADVVLVRQAQAVAATFALGLVDPGGQARDPR